MLPGVADEPLVGLDGDRAVARVLVAEQRRRDALRVAAVAQLAVELVDEVAAVGEDQDAAGARRLDEAERGDGLAGAGRVLEPEALGGVGVLGRLGDAPRRRRDQSTRLLVAVLAPRRRSSCVLLAGDAGGGELDRLVGGRRAPLPFPLPLRCASASSAVSVPESASTWWADSTVPSTSVGSSSDEQALEPEQQRVAAPPLDRGRLGAARRARPARRRARGGAACRGRARSRRPRLRAGTARG